MQTLIIAAIQIHIKTAIKMNNIKDTTPNIFEVDAVTSASKYISNVVFGYD